MEQILDALQKKQNERENLILLAEHLRKCPEAWKVRHREQCIVLVRDLLGHTDAKVRKNAAKVLGHFYEPSLIVPLMEAYRRETVRYVRSQYLMSLTKYDMSQFREELAERREMLFAEAESEELRKHANEEIRAINSCIGTEREEKHTFTGMKLKNEVMLILNPLYTDEAMRFIGDTKKKAVNGGVIVHTEHLAELCKLRCYRELLFLVPELYFVEDDPYEIAAHLASSEMRAFLRERHDGGEVFTYRIELRGTMEERKKSLFMKRLCGEVFRLSEQRLQNVEGNHEIEFRLIQRATGGYRLLVKLLTLADERFRYRRECVATSIQPSDAAFCFARFASYLREDAQILDPFCGVGTMLAERSLAKKVKIAFGVDTFGEAIEKAKKNMWGLGLPIHYIHRDFFDFRHETLFDEIVTNMPFRKGEEDEKICNIYKRFFEKAEEHLKRDGVILMVSHNPQLVRRYLTAEFEIASHCALREKVPMEAFLIRRRGIA